MKVEVQIPLAPVVEIVFPRWKAQVLWALLTRGRLRFGEIARELPRIAPSMLTLRLKELEADGFIVRNCFAESPPRVEYAVTDLGRSLKPIFDDLLAWSARHLPEVEASRSRRK
ncbi:helix-turn-helix domain-containing protein [Actinoplanes sp. NPDC089786]|uniref:winged helix-turn-helix transcriptional regulator n=1 Tax=Actinoplanes sp. NPDC089786 TaxID=3155185 RepID=UPI0034326D44